MNTVIALKGKSNVCKSMTIKKVYELLKERYPEYVIESQKMNDGYVITWVNQNPEEVNSDQLKENDATVTAILMHVEEAMVADKEILA
jgi:hypothetical protein